MQIQSPVRPNDFVNSNSIAPLCLLEELNAIDRFPLVNITPHSDWNGFVTRLNNSPRFKKWWFERDVRRLFLIEAAEVGPFDTTVLISRGLNEGPDTPKFAAICPWTMVPAAVETLRSIYIGPDYLTREPDGDKVPGAYIGEILAGLKLPEVSLNSRELSGFCRLKWGILLRIGPADMERTLDYLAIPQPTEGEPAEWDLGANMRIIVAFSPSETEPLRVGICWRWDEDLALKDAQRWLRSFVPRPDKKILSPVS